MCRKTIVLASFLLVAGMAQAQARPPKPPKPPRPPVAAAPAIADFSELSQLGVDLADLQGKLDLELQGKLDLELDRVLSMNLEPALAAAGRTLDALSLHGALADVEEWQSRSTPRAYVRGGDSESIDYARGTSYLDQGRYEQALQAFDKAITAGGKRTDAAMYWKAYSLNRLGRGREALATLDDLLKKYPSSRWANDARALQVEVKQASGRQVNPAQENDEELKLLALNGLVARDPERGVPMVEQILSGSASPRMKERALFLLAQSGSPRGKTMLADIAKGKGGNPDLQMKALEYLGVFGADVPLLVDVYKGTSDTDVKRRVIRSLAIAGGRRGPGFGAFIIPPIPPIPPVPPVPAIAGEHLSKQEMEKAMEKAQEEYQRAREEAQRAVAETQRNMREAAAANRTTARTERDKAREAKAKEASDALWQLYQAESSVELKREMLRNMYFGDQSDRLVQIARTEKAPELRQAAVQALMFSHTPKSAETLITLYRDEKDPSVKRRIVDVLGTMEGSAGYLVQLARQETDPQLRKMLVQRLSLMKDKEATDYMMELLKK